MTMKKNKKLKQYAPPCISSDIIYLEEGIAALSEVSTRDVDGKIYENTVEESIGESFDW